MIAVVTSCCYKIASAMFGITCLRILFSFHHSLSVCYDHSDDEVWRNTCR